MKFKYLQNCFDNNVCSYGADTGHITAACRRDKFTICTHGMDILVGISVFVHAACCCEMLILQFDPLCVSQFLCFMHLVVFVTSYICYSLSQPAKGAREKHGIHDRFRCALVVPQQYNFFPFEYGCMGLEVVGEGGGVAL